MFSENIWWHLCPLIHLTWQQNFAVGALPCSVSIVKTRWKLSTLLTRIHQQIQARMEKKSLVNMCCCSVFLQGIYAQATASGDTDRWLICSFERGTVSSCLGVIGSSGLLISATLMQGRKAAGSSDCTQQSFTSFQRGKMMQPWLQKVTRMIASLDLNQTSAHDYLSKGCMTHVGDVLRNKWNLVMLYYC